MSIFCKHIWVYLPHPKHPQLKGIWLRERFGKTKAINKIQCDKSYKIKTIRDGDKSYCAYFPSTSKATKTNEEVQDGR